MCPPTPSGPVPPERTTTKKYPGDCKVLAISNANLGYSGLPPSGYLGHGQWWSPGLTHYSFLSSLRHAVGHDCAKRASLRGELTVA